MIGRSLVRIPSRLIFFCVKKNQPTKLFRHFLIFYIFFIFLNIFLKFFFIFCVPRMPRTPRTVPRTPRCLALCKDPFHSPLCVWCYIIILLTNNCGLFVLGTEASSWTSLWIQQEFDLCVVETFILTPAQLYAVICYGKWMINKELINFIDQQQSW